MHRILRATAVCLVILGVTPGCAHRTKTIRTEERVAHSSDTVPATTQVVTDRTTTQTTTATTSEEPRGLLSTTVHVIGEILALPFRLVGGLLRIIF